MTTPNQIAPTENDVPGSPAGIGAEITEALWRDRFGTGAIGRGAGINFVVSGFTLDNIDGSLVATFTTGKAIIDGLFVDHAEDTVQLVDNAYNYVYVQLDDSGGKCVGAHLQRQGDGTIPNDAVLIWAGRIVSAGLVANWDRRIQSANGAYGSASGAHVPVALVIGFAPTLAFFTHDDASVSLLTVAGVTRLVDNGDSTSPSLESYGIDYKAAASCSWYAIR